MNSAAIRIEIKTPDYPVPKSVQTDYGVIRCGSHYINIDSCEILYNVSHTTVVMSKYGIGRYVVMGCTLDGKLCFQPRNSFEDENIVDLGSNPFHLDDAQTPEAFKSNYIFQSAVDQQWLPHLPKQGFMGNRNPLYWIKDTTANITVIVQNGERILFHSVVIENNFPHFHKILNWGPNGSVKKVIKLPETPYHVMQIIKYYVYTGYLPDEYAAGVLKLQEETETEWCENLNNSLLQTIQFADQFQLWDLVQTIIKKVFSDTVSGGENWGMEMFYKLAKVYDNNTLSGHILKHANEKDLKKLLQNTITKDTDIIWAFKHHASDNVRHKSILKTCKFVLECKHLQFPLKCIPPVFAFCSEVVLKKIYDLEIFDKDAMEMYMNMVVLEKITELTLMKKREIIETLSESSLPSKVEFLKNVSKKKRKIQETYESESE